MPYVIADDLPDEPAGVRFRRLLDRPEILQMPGAHLGIAKVPDERLDRCAALFSPKSTVRATIEFVDVAGLNKGASGTTQFTTGFLAAVKSNDALIQVVRLFDDPPCLIPTAASTRSATSPPSKPSSSSATWPCSSRA